MNFKFILNLEHVQYPFHLLATFFLSMSLKQTHVLVCNILSSDVFFHRIESIPLVHCFTNVNIGKTPHKKNIDARHIANHIQIAFLHLLMHICLLIMEKGWGETPIKGQNIVAYSEFAGQNLKLKTWNNRGFQMYRFHFRS